jgi:hypothetical protein
MRLIVLTDGDALLALDLPRLTPSERGARALADA